MEITHGVTVLTISNCEIKSYDCKIKIVRKSQCGVYYQVHKKKNIYFYFSEMETSFHCYKSFPKIV